MGFHSYFYMSNCDVISYVIGNYDTFCIKLMSLLQTYVFYLLYLLSCYEIFLLKTSHLESFFIYCVVVYRNVTFSQGRILGCYKGKGGRPHGWCPEFHPAIRVSTR